MPRCLNKALANRTPLISEKNSAAILTGLAICEIGNGENISAMLSFYS